MTSERSSKENEKGNAKEADKMDEKALVIRPAEAGEEEDILFFIIKGVWTSLSGRLV